MDTYISRNVQSTSDTLLLMMLFEGKDFQTARKDLKNRETLAEASASEPSSTSWNSFSSDSLEISAISITHLEAQISTAQGSVRIEATHLEAAAFSAERTSSSPTSQDPLLIDLTGEGPQTTGEQGARSFDLAGNGETAPTSFARGGTAFLALDRNGNGSIDSGAELFGDQHGAVDGYEELGRFDADANGRIDAADPVFSRLSLLYGDGSQQSLVDAGLQAISLAARTNPMTTSSGDRVLRSATAMTSDGRSLDTYAMALRQFNQTV